MIKKAKYLIIGAGPSGLGAGWHLKKRGINDFLILEKENYAGGLSASFKDKKGFYWDLGGHVLFGNNKEFIEIIESFLGKDLVKHRRKAGIYFKRKFIPYPFQDNVACLPKLLYKKVQKDLNNRLQGVALQGLQELENFQEWLCATFGETLSEIFFIPQNEKSWAYPLEKMSYSWIAKKIKLPIASAKSDLKINKKGWGSNAEFYYPKTGGIGTVWQKMAQSYGNKIKFKNEVKAINIGKKKVYLKTGEIVNYEYLISTMPLDVLLRILLPQKKRNKTKDYKRYAATWPLLSLSEKKLKCNKGLIVGLGIKGKLNNDFHWLYYPQKEFPFFRLVFPSNFSFVPKGHCSIIAEVSLEQGRKLEKADKEKIIQKVIDSVKKLSLFKGKIVSVFDKQVDYFYPIPTLKRDVILEKISRFLNKKQIFSIGRFGGWKYENGNMDDGFLACELKSALNT